MILKNNPKVYALKIRDLSFIPLPIIFNSSTVFCKNPLFVPRLFVTYFFIWQQELIWSYVLLILSNLVIPYFIEYVIILD